MSSNSIFSSIESEKRWVLEMKRNFSKEHDAIDDNSSDNAPTCVFRVPTMLSKTKPEAYTPQLIGLGPYHHFRPDIYQTRMQKLSAVREFLIKKELIKMEPTEKELWSVQEVVEALISMEPVLRACYDQHLDLDIQTLAWVIVVDGLYLLKLLLDYYSRGMEDILLEKRAGDLCMLENQIPVVLLRIIDKALGYDNSRGHFDNFCYWNSPLRLNEQSAVLGDESQLHLLHRMYYLIVNNRGIKDPRPTSGPVYCSLSFDNVNDAIGFLAEQGVPGASIAGRILSFVGETVNWCNTLGLFKNESSDGENDSVEKIDIPTVSQMTEIAGIKFALTPGGIRDISLHDRRKETTFYLPVIRLNPSSEIILRNLVAYEAVSAKPGTTLELAEYVDLMCGIIDTVKDVGILRKEKIIDSELPDEEIVRIFNGIGKPTGKNEKKSKLEEAIDEVNWRCNNAGRVKVKRFFRKYVYASFKILRGFVTMIVFVLLVLNSFCSAFGCDPWFDNSGSTCNRVPT